MAQQPTLTAFMVFFLKFFLFGHIYFALFAVIQYLQYSVTSGHFLMLTVDMSGGDAQTGVFYFEMHWADVDSEALLEQLGLTQN